MGKYSLTNKAVDDLSDIWNYTYETWSEDQADRYYELLIDTFHKLSERPELGKRYDVPSKEDIFGFHVGKHIVFYRPPKAKKIEILRILHERMDVKNRMSK